MALNPGLWAGGTGAQVGSAGLGQGLQPGAEREERLVKGLFEGWRFGRKSLK